MFCAPELMLNKHKDVDIPKPHDYVQRFGLAGVPASQFTGDEAAPIGLSKTDQLRAAEDYDRYCQQMENEANKE